MSLFEKLFGKKNGKAKEEKKKLPEEEDGQVKYMKPKEKTPEAPKPAPIPEEKSKEVKVEPKAAPAPKAEEKAEPKPEETKKPEPKETPAVKEAATAPKAAEKSTAPKKTAVPKPAAKSEEKKPAETKKAAPAKAPAVEEKPAEDTNEEAEKIATADTSESVALPAKTGPVGKFDLKKSKDGRFVFNLLAANRVIVATSQVYSSSTAAMNGIHSVIANAAKAPVEDQTLKNYTPVGYPKWEIYLDKGNQYRFRLNASNGSCICHSQGYTTKASCKNGIESIIRTVKDADTEKSYLKKDDAKK